MKIAIALFLFTAVSIGCAVQQSNKNIAPKLPVAKVKNWTNRALILRKDFWTLFGDTVVKQIGAQEFEKVKRFSAVERIPYELTLFKGFQPINKDSLAALDSKLGELVTYNIATLIYRGNEKGARDRVILRVPYNENKDWDPKAKWDTVYFLLPLSDIEH